jgi:tRNA G10  N-methylase Trm11
MTNYIFFLGHQPHLSLAELESVFGSKTITEFNNKFAVLELAQEPNIDRLGGTTKISKVLQVTKSEEDLEKQPIKLITQKVTEQKTSKLKLGISIYSGDNTPKLSRKFVQKILEQIRVDLKNTHKGLNLHTISPKNSELSTAQLIHSGLLKNNGLSLDVLIEKGKLTLAQTIQVPNLRKYTLRDYGKPKPSAVNGMLPPKLAQILINLSGARESKSSGDHILDPFCGSGTVLQEALLMGINCTGTDLNTKIIDDTEENLEWLDKRFKLRDENAKFNLEVADATSHHWQTAFTHVVCEGYLGTPLSKEPSEAKLKEIINECNSVATGFFENLASRLKPEQRLVIALPCWFIGKEQIKLPVVENLSALGYNLLKSKKNQNDLVYHREDQIVGRDIYILSKK